MAKKTPGLDNGTGENIIIANTKTAGTVDTTAGIVDGLVKDSSIDIQNIPDLDVFLVELRDKGLIGLPNYNTGTMYYVPKNAVQSYKSVSRIGSIKLGNDDEINEGIESFAGVLGSMATSNLSEVYVLDGEEYVKTDSNDGTFEVLGKHPECIKISGLQPDQLESRKVLFFNKEGGIPVALNLINDDGLPIKLDNYR